MVSLDVLPRQEKGVIVLTEREKDEEIIETDVWFVTSRILHTGLIFIVTYGGARIIELDNEQAKEVAILTSGVGYFENDAVRKLSFHLQRLTNIIRKDDGSSKF